METLETLVNFWTCTAKDEIIRKQEEIIAQLKLEVLSYQEECEMNDYKCGIAYNCLVILIFFTNIRSTWNWVYDYRFKYKLEHATQTYATTTAEQATATTATTETDSLSSDEGEYISERPQDYRNFQTT